MFALSKKEGLVAADMEIFRRVKSCNLTENLLKYRDSLFNLKRTDLRHIKLIFSQGSITIVLKEILHVTHTVLKRNHLEA